MFVLFDFALLVIAVFGWKKNERNKKNEKTKHKNTQRNWYMIVFTDRPFPPTFVVEKMVRVKR